MFSVGNDILLRSAEPSDAACIYKWENDRSIWRVSETLAPYSMHQIERFLLNNNDLLSECQLRIMIMTTHGNTPVGCIDIFDYDAFNGRAGIGILIDKDHRGKGYASQALEMTIDYCFNSLILKQVYSTTMADNHDSIRLFENSGFKRCGLKKDWYKTTEGYVDQIEFQYINTNK